MYVPFDTIAFYLSKNNVVLNSKTNTLKIGTVLNSENSIIYQCFWKAEQTSQWLEVIAIIIINNCWPIVFEELSPGVLTITKLTWIDNNIEKQNTKNQQKTQDLIWKCVKI